MIELSSKPMTLRSASAAQQTYPCRIDTQFAHNPIKISRALSFTAARARAMLLPSTFRINKGHVYEISHPVRCCSGDCPVGTPHRVGESGSRVPTTTVELLPQLVEKYRKWAVHPAGKRGRH